MTKETTNFGQWILQRTFSGPNLTITASSATLIALALFFAEARRYAFAQALFFIAAAAPLLVLGGYLNHAPGLVAMTFNPTFAIYTALCLIMLCFGGLLIQPRKGPMRVVMSQSIAESLARKLLPLAVAMPLAAGFVILIGERSGFISVEFGLALLVSCCVLLFAIAVWITTTTLWRSERVQIAAEQELPRTRSRLESALIAGEIGTWQWHVEKDQVFADQTLAAMFSVSPEEADGGPVEAYLRTVLEEDRSTIQNAIDEALKNGVNSFQCDFRLIRPDGETRWVLARGRIERDSDGQATSFPGIVVDITEQKRMQMDLGHSEAQRRLALDTAELGAWILMCGRTASTRMSGSA